MKLNHTIISILFSVSIGGLLIFVGQRYEPASVTELTGFNHNINIVGQTTNAQSTVSLPISEEIRFTAKTDPLLEPSVTAQAVFVQDMENGDILYQKNAGSTRQLASITKLLTAIVVLDEYSMGTNQYIQMTQSAFDTYGGDTLSVGSYFMIEDLLRAVLMVSSNDAASLLAEHFGGGDTKVFIEKMNTKAKDLGMIQSKFTNPHGLDDDFDQHYSTAGDIIKLIKAMNEYPDIIPILQTLEYTLVSREGQSITIGNTNTLLDNPMNIVGKTGLTDDAGETFAAQVSIQGKKVGIVVLGSSIGGYRFQDTQNLIQWIEDNYTTQL